MRIGELASYILFHDANSIENHPELYSSYETIEGLKIVDKVKDCLMEKYATDVIDTNTEFRLMSHDFSNKEIMDVLDEVYIMGTLPSIDSWIEENN